MISRSTLLADLQRLLKKLENDLRARAESISEIDTKLKAQHAQAVADKRTGAAFPEWREELITQVGVAWILGCVFVRFLEDNAFLDAPLISGPSERLALARDAHTAYVREHPTDSDREYLLHVFTTVAKLPVLAGLFDAKHNPLWLFGPSADGAQELLTFWHQTDPATGTLRHNFTDSECDTRFLGDLYQDLSEAARKRYALLQTPVFVEEFILDRTLEPAIATFGLATVRMIDPTCGSGHFLLGGFRRLLEHWQKAEPGTNVRELVRRALDAVYGIDLNPFAVAIARFRLLIAALRASEIQKLRNAPALPLHVATGDSLLFGRRRRSGHGRQRDMFTADPLAHAYETEDAELATKYLDQAYHAVVGNPPYITVKDKAENEAYRQRFPSCHRKYSLAVPFFERFFELAIRGDGTAKEHGGYVGKITANPFMKREFGKKLVETFIPHWDLTHIIDTDKAHLPGHATGTIIILGRDQDPVSPTIRTVMGIRKQEPAPENPAEGLVWQAIIAQVDQPGSQSDYVSVSDTARESFHKHPWSIGGGGAAELKELVDQAGDVTLGGAANEIGVFGMTNADEVMLAPAKAFFRRSVETDVVRSLVVGDGVRDWLITTDDSVLFPYSEAKLVPIARKPGLFSWLWRCRTTIGNRATFERRTYFEEGRAWWAWHQVTLERLDSPLTITFSEVATHNHFVLDRGGKVFKQTAPVIKLTVKATEEDHLGLLGVLNSSTSCFYLRQVCHDKGGGGIGGGISAEMWEHRFAFNGTQVGGLPLPAERPLPLARELERLAQQLQAHAPAAVLTHSEKHSRKGLESARTAWMQTLARMIALQEELDWTCYALYGLLDVDDPAAGTELRALGFGADTIPDLQLGQRSFEIVLARRIAAGEEQSTWFERHRSRPITELPAEWPAEYRAVVERRIQLIESNRNIGLIERPEYKRRWNVETWDEQLTKALRSWLLERIETPHYWAAIELTSVHQLAERARTDADFMRVAELFTDRPDFDVARLVGELVADESVPSLPGQRYKDSGLRKRAQWEETWDKQRQEDAITARILKGKPPEAADDPAIKQEIKSAIAAEVGAILVPPKYSSADFQKSSYWRLRGKLDVPKERFISYPGAERTVDSSLVVAWAGWDHLQQAQAIAAHFQKLKDDGAPETQLARALASLHQLLPWLLQWHNDLHPEFHERMGDFFRTYVEDEARRLHQTADDLKTLANTRT